MDSKVHHISPHNIEDQTGWAAAMPLLKGKVRMNRVWIIAFGILIASCASNGFLMAKPVVTLYGESYPTKSVDAKIDVFQTAKPEASYSEIGQIICGDTEDDWNMNQILTKAREIGADGIIIVGRVGTYGVGAPVGNMAMATSEEYGMKAIAIKYK